MISRLTFVKCCGLLAAQGLGLVSRAADARPLRTVAGWEELFLARWDVEDAESFRPRSTSGDAWHLYDLAYGVDASLAMFQATGNPRYLDRALAYTLNVISTARVSSSFATSQFGDSFHGWVNHSHPHLAPDDGKEYPLFESYLWRYVINLLLAMKADAAVWQTPAYRAQYERILAFTERNIFDKWFQRGVDANIYRVNTHMAAHWAMISLGLSRLTDNAERRARCVEIHTNIDWQGLPPHGGSLRGQMRKTESGAYFWNANWGQTTPPGQDVSHGNAVIAYVVQAHSLGNYWTDADMEAFKLTLDRVIWPRADYYNEFVDGTGGERTGWHNPGWFNDGFVKLGRFDAALQRRLEAHAAIHEGFAYRGQAKHYAGSVEDPRRMTVQFYGNGALNAKLLGAI